MRFQGRSAFILQNELAQISVLKEGGHIAEFRHKPSGVNPLWVPPWTSIEPSQYKPAEHPEYGLNSESQLLSGLMGHNLCLDIFGPPSETEAAAGLGVHGESSVVAYQFEQASDTQLRMSASLPLAGLRITRELTLDGTSLHFQETVKNLTALDRPIAWTQHVTLGPPFLDSETRFAMPALRSRTFESAEFDNGVMAVAADFAWPHLPLSNGATVDLSHFDYDNHFSRFSTHLMNPESETAGFAAWSRTHNLLFGYRWSTADFPWLGMWQENRQRTIAPWSGRTITCGMEFGVSPYPETRRQMIERGSLFGVPAYKWLPARGVLSARYSAFIQTCDDAARMMWTVPS
jgi:hypothetical protein